MFIDIACFVGVACTLWEHERPMWRTVVCVLFCEMAEFMDAHGLLLEMQSEMEQLSDPKLTHIGVGFAEDSTKVLVVELLAESAFVVKTLQPGEDGSIHVEGYNLMPTEMGLYAA